MLKSSSHRRRRVPTSSVETKPSAMRMLLLPLMGIVLIQVHLITAAPPVRAPAATKTLAGIEASEDQHGVFLALNHINATDGSKTQIANFSGGFDPQVLGCTFNSEANTFSFFNGFRLMTVNAATGAVVYDVDVSFFRASQQGVENLNWMQGNVMFYTSGWYNTQMLPGPIWTVYGTVDASTGRALHFV